MWLFAEKAHTITINAFKLKHKCMGRTVDSLVRNPEESLVSFLSCTRGGHFAADVKNRDCLKNSDGSTLSTSANYFLQHDHILLW